MNTSTDSAHQAGESGESEDGREGSEARAAGPAGDAGTPRTAEPPGHGAPAAPDWAAFVERYWEREPVVLPAGVRAEAAGWFRLAVTASAPFRSGTRLGAVPDVRFDTTEGLLRSPGPLLPDAHDGVVARYRERVRGELAGCGWQLTVTHPSYWTSVCGP